MKTFTPKKEQIKREVVLVDLEGKILGRAAAKVADLLRGKGSPFFAKHINTGDTVVAINAAKIKVTGKKLEQKRYYSFSGYPGGIRSRTLSEVMARKPEEAFRAAVKGMLPKNKLQKEYLKHLKIYAGPEHPHAPQNPRKVEL